MKKLLVSLTLILSLMLSMGLSAFAEDTHADGLLDYQIKAGKVKKELYIDNILDSSVGAKENLDLVDIYVSDVSTYDPSQFTTTLTFKANVRVNPAYSGKYALLNVEAINGNTTGNPLDTSIIYVENCRTDYTQSNDGDPESFSYQTTLRIYLKSVFSTPGGSIAEDETYGENTAVGVTNEGTINDNKINGSIANNYGTVVENNGIIENNFGRVIKNCNKIVNQFFTDYTVPIPSGTVENYYHPMSIEGQLSVTPNEAGGEILDGAWIKSLSHPDPNSITLYSYTVEPAAGWILDEESLPAGCGVIKKDGKWIITNIIFPVNLVAKPVPAAPGEPAPATPSAPVTDVPATGDMSNLPLWGSLLLLFAVTAVVTKKKKV